MRNTKKVFYFSMVAALVGCNGSASNSSAVDSNKHATTATSKVQRITIPLSADALGVIPARSSNASFIMHINNNSSEAFTLIDTVVDNPDILKVNSICKTLAANASCSVELIPHSNKSAATVVHFKFKNSSGKVFTVNKLVRMSSEISSINGIVVANTQPDVSAPNGNYGMAIPVVLDKNFDDIKVLNGKLECGISGYKAGTSCTYLLSGHALGDNTLLTPKITGYRKDKEVATYTNNVLLKSNIGASLILPASLEVKPGQTTDYQIVNEGIVDATNIQIKDTENVLDVVNTCSTIPSGNNNTCTVQLKLKNDASVEIKSTVLEITYLSGSQSITDTTKVNIVHQPQIPTITPGGTGSLEHVLVGSSATREITFTNPTKSAFTLRGVTQPRLPDGVIFNPSSFNPTDATHKKCSSGLVLKPNEGCYVAYQYNPVKEVSSSSFNLQFTGQFANNLGRITINTPVQYSSLDPATLNYFAFDKVDDMRVLTTNDLNETGARFVESREYVLRNLAAASVTGTLDKLDFTNSVVGLKFLTSVPGITDECADGTVLDQQSPTCSGKIAFGPTNTVGTNKSALKFGVELSGSAQGIQDVKSNEIELEAHSSGAVIRTTSEISQFPTYYENDGKRGVKFLALNNAADQLTIKYTFTNVGTESATSLNISTGKIDFSVVSADISDSTIKYCKVGSNNITQGTNILSPGESCSVVLRLPQSSFNQGFNELPLVANMKWPLGYSYLDTTTGSNVHRDVEELNWSFSFSRRWAEISYDQTNDVTIQPGLQTTKFIVKPTVTVDPRITQNTYPVTLEPINSFFNHQVGCTLQDSSGSCELTLEAARALFGTGELLPYEIDVSGTGPAVASAFTTETFNVTEPRQYRIAYFSNVNNTVTEGLTGDLLSEAKKFFSLFVSTSGVSAANAICDSGPSRPGSSITYYAAVADGTNPVFEPDTRYLDTNLHEIFTTDANGRPTPIATSSALVLPTNTTDAYIHFGFDNNMLTSGTNHCNNWISSLATEQSSVMNARDLFSPSGFATVGCNATTNQNAPIGLMCVERVRN